MTSPTFHIRTPMEIPQWAIQERQLIATLNDAARAFVARYVRPDGTLEHVACDVLLLACNGFGGNPQRVARHLPEMAQAIYGGHVGNDGTALDWGDLIGADQADLGAYQGHGSWAVPQGGLVTWALMMEGGVQINALGQRFHDETQGYSEAAVEVLAQPGSQAWCVFDDPILTLAQNSCYYTLFLYNS